MCSSDLEDVFIEAEVQESFIGLQDLHFLVPNLISTETIFMDQLVFSGTPSQFSIDSFRLNYEKSNFLGSFYLNSSSSSKLTIQEFSLNPKDIETLFPSLEKSSIDFLKRFEKTNISGTLASQSANHKLNLLVDSRLGPLQFNFDFFQKEIGRAHV